jgi:hypothetical protein
LIVRGGPDDGSALQSVKKICLRELNGRIKNKRVLKRMFRGDFEGDDGLQQEQI